MFRASSFWTFLLGWTCVVPAALPAGPLQDQAQGDVLTQLQGEWSRTVAALESLRGFESQIAAGQPPALGTVGTQIEPARWSLEEAGDHLVELSRSIRDLEAELQSLRARPPRRPVPGLPLQNSDGSALKSAAGITTGIDGELKQRQDRAQRERQTPNVSATPLELPANVTLTSARAAYQAGDYPGALAQFQRLPDSPAVRHWIARSLERVGRTKEALEQYDALAADPAAAAAAYQQRAQSDADFLRWKLSLAPTPQSPKQ